MQWIAGRPGGVGKPERFRMACGNALNLPGEGDQYMPSVLGRKVITPGKQMKKMTRAARRKM